jgi:hypothetical protein
MVYDHSALMRGTWIPAALGFGPRDVDALLDVPGIGPAKCSEYGQGILEALERVNLNSRI